MKSKPNKDLPTRDIRDMRKGTSAVIYGRSGSGKTTLAASAPTGILYLDVRDDGTDSISDLKGIRVRDIGHTEDFEDTFWWLKDNPKKYKTVIVDTCSNLQTMRVQETGSNKKGKKAGEWGSMSRGDWGDVAAWMKEWLTNYRDLTADGMNVIFIAQDRTFNLSDEEERNEHMLAPEVGPALSPSVARHLNASVNVIGNTFIRERVVKDKVTKKRKVYVEYCFGVGPSGLYTRKVRKPKSVKLPDVIVDPTWEDITDLIEGA